MLVGLKGVLYVANVLRANLYRLSLTITEKSLAKSIHNLS
jgi:hypothetical protein